MSKNIKNAESPEIDETNTDVVEQADEQASQTSRSRNPQGRPAFQTPAKHHVVLQRAQLRVENARKALADAEKGRYEKIVRAFNDGTKTSAIARSLGAPYVLAHREVTAAKEAGDITV